MLGPSRFSPVGLVREVLASVPHGAPLLLVEIVRRAMSADRRGANPRNKKHAHAYKVKVLSGLTKLTQSGEVEKLPGRAGYRLRTGAFPRAAVERAIRRLQAFLSTLDIPSERRGTWPESGWLHARHAIAQAVVVVEPDLERQLGRPLREPSKVERSDMDHRNPRVLVTIPGWSLTVDTDTQDLGETFFVQGVEQARRESCGVCARLLPHGERDSEFHDQLAQMLEKVREFDPAGHAHAPPCSDQCRAFWNLDYVRGMMQLVARDIPAWTGELPPAPKAPLARLDGRPTETQTPTLPPEAAPPQKAERPAAKRVRRHPRGTSRRSP